MKYTTQSAAGAARAASLMAPDISVAEAPTTRGAQKVDPSVKLGPLGEMTVGAVPMSVTIGKPQAYTAKKGSP